MFSYMYIGLLASESSVSLIDVNPGLIVWTIVTFILLLIILKKFAWKPILSALDQRENAIKEALEKADKAKQEAQLLLQQNQVQINKAEEESKKILQQSREYAEKLKDDLLQKSKEESARLREDAMQEIERKKNEAFASLRNEVAGIAIQAAEKILKQNIDTDTNTKLVNQYLSEINK
ncbi:MAG: F0F1 ATP synthase subunit B [Bacteroidota bacterium]|nr:F0F1 ATP synthase subunit B [Bacteroidota bacterium]